MIVRRIERKPASNATISVRMSWGLPDVAALMKRVGQDLREVGAMSINESDLRTVVGGVLFGGMRPYQQAPLIDWAISVARRSGMLEECDQAGKIKIIV